MKLGHPPQRAKQEHIMRVSENRVLHTVRGHQGQEDSENGITTASKFILSTNITTVIKSRRVRKNMQGKDGYCIQMLVRMLERITW